MTDKTAIGKKIGNNKDYCNKKGTSCYYNEKNICVICGRSKGWRKNR